MKGYKATNPDLTCRDLQYVIGEQMSHKGKIDLCGAGLHFCEDLADCLLYYPVTSRFFKVVATGVKPNEYQTDKRVARHITLVKEVELPWEDEEFQLKLVKKGGQMLQHIPNPTEKVKIASVIQNDWSIKYITDPSIEVQMAAVENDGYAIEYIPNASLEVQRAAVKQTGFAITYIKDPTEEVCLLAIKQNIQSFKYMRIKYPSVEAIIVAYEQKNPDEVVERFQPVQMWRKW